MQKPESAETGDTRESPDKNDKERLETDGKESAGNEIAYPSDQESRREARKKQILDEISQLAISVYGRSSIHGHNDNSDNSDDGYGGKNHDSIDLEPKECTVKPEDIITTFEDVHVSPDAIEALENVLLPIQFPQQFNFGILSKSPPTGVLLYGVPGTGKTQLVRALAKKADAIVLTFSPANIKSKWIGVSEKKIQRIFSFASKQKRPCVLFFDEADTLFTSRSVDSIKSGEHSIVAQFLAEMDGIFSSGLGNVIVIAATNRPFDIDEAILCRLGRRILIEIPDDCARQKILEIHLQGESISDDMNIEEIVRMTKDYTGSDLRDLIYTAAITAVREISQRGVHIASEVSSRVLRREHLLKALGQISPAPKEDMVKKIQEFHEKFGSPVRKPPEKKKEAFQVPIRLPLPVE